MPCARGRSFDQLMVFVLDHRYYLVEDLLAKQHLNQMLMKDHRNHMNEDPLNKKIFFKLRKCVNIRYAK